jgi:hypothetical protein
MSNDVSQRSSLYKKLLLALGFLLIMVLIVVLVFVRPHKDSSKEQNLNTKKDSNNSKDSNLLSVNTCPDELTNVSGRPTAVLNGKNLDMSKEVYDWVLANCSFNTDGTKKSSEKPVISNLGVNFGKYDPATGKAGDFVFSKESINMNSGGEDKIFFEFGSKIQVSGEVYKTFPEIVYNQLDIKTPVTAIGDGTVFKISTQPESNDFSLEIRFNDDWMFIYDHVIDLKFKEGDKVKSGEVLGTVSTNKDLKTGYLEIQIKQASGNTESTSYCPLQLLSTSQKATYSSKITQLMKDWEAFMNNKNLYAESAQVEPGCLLSTITE